MTGAYEYESRVARLLFLPMPETRISKWTSRQFVNQYPCQQHREGIQRVIEIYLPRSALLKANYVAI